MSEHELHPLGQPITPGMSSYMTASGAAGARPAPGGESSDPWIAYDNGARIGVQCREICRHFGLPAGATLADGEAIARTLNHAWREWSALPGAAASGRDEPTCPSSGDGKHHPHVEPSGGVWCGWCAMPMTSVRDRLRAALTSAAHNGDLLITAGNREDFIDDVLAALRARSAPRPGGQAAGDSERCDAEVWAHGEVIGWNRMDKANAEECCRMLRAADPASRVDWHFVGGRPVFKRTAAGGVGLIAAERARQVAAEGWTQEHDDEHWHGELAQAASCYARADPVRVEAWPWDRKWWKPTPADRVRELVKAGALVAAEIDRLLRAAERGPAGGGRDRTFANPAEVGIFPRRPLTRNDVPVSRGTT